MLPAQVEKIEEYRLHLRSLSVDEIKKDVSDWNQILHTAVESRRKAALAMFDLERKLVPPDGWAGCTKKQRKIAMYEAYLENAEYLELKRMVLACLSYENNCKIILMTAEQVLQEKIVEQWFSDKDGGVLRLDK